MPHQGPALIKGEAIRGIRARLAQLPEFWATRYLDILGVANPLQQPRQAGVGGGVQAQPEHHPIPAGLDLRALTGPAFSLSNRPPEPLRPRQAKLHTYQALHPDQANQPNINPIARRVTEWRAASCETTPRRSKAGR
jgi:hypothetical protein